MSKYVKNMLNTFQSQRKISLKNIRNEFILGIVHLDIIDIIWYIILV